MDDPGDPANADWWHNYDLETYGHDRSYQDRWWEWSGEQMTYGSPLKIALRAIAESDNTEREERRQQKELDRRLKQQEKLNTEPSLRGADPESPPVFDGHKATRGLRGVKAARQEAAIRRLGIYMPTRVETIQQPPFLMSELPTAAPSLATDTPSVNPSMGDAVAALNGKMVAAQAQMMAQMASTLKQISKNKRPRTRKSYRRPKVVYRRPRKTYRRARKSYRRRRW